MLNGSMTFSNPSSSPPEFFFFWGGGGGGKWDMVEKGIYISSISVMMINFVFKLDKSPLAAKGN
jgi:hypothetical protein